MQGAHDLSTGLTRDALAKAVGGTKREVLKFIDEAAPSPSALSRLTSGQGKAKNGA